MNEMNFSCIAPEDEELAAQYAYELSRDPSNAYAIALRLTYADYGKAVIMSQQWTQDQSFKDALRGNAELLTTSDLLKTEEQFALEVQEKMGTLNGKLWLDCARLYADLRGFVKKEAQQQVFIQNVIEVPATPPLDDWEQEASKRQRQLQQEARTIDGNTSS